MSQILSLRDYLNSNENLGTIKGCETFRKLESIVDKSPEDTVFRILMTGLPYIDALFIRESIVKLASDFLDRYKFCLVLNLYDDDLLESCRLATEDSKQPLTIWYKGIPKIFGPKVSKPLQSILSLVLEQREVTVSQVAKTLGKRPKSISAHLKHLQLQGFIMRSKVTQPSGGIEYLYRIIS